MLIRIALSLVCLLLASAADAERLKIQRGKNTVVFDINLGSGPVEVFVPRKGENETEDHENVAHDHMSLEDVLALEPKLSRNFTIGRAKGVSNAFAAIFEGERLIVYDPKLVGSWAGARWLAIFGHEVGHHICGHTAGIMTENPWDKELEADRFSGFLVRLMHDKIPFTNGILNDVLSVAREIHPQKGSTTHPPQSMRLAAITEGFSNGSLCVGRSVPPLESRTSLKQVLETIWSSDGGVFRMEGYDLDRSISYRDDGRSWDGSVVPRGSVLFYGKKIGRRYAGTARDFTEGCMLEYEVAGEEANDGQTITLTGRAPLPGPGCRFGDYRPKEYRVMTTRFKRVLQ